MIASSADFYLAGDVWPMANRGAVLDRWPGIPNRSRQIAGPRFFGKRATEALAEAWLNTVRRRRRLIHSNC